MNCSYCIDDTGFQVKVACIETKCKYHKKEGAVYSPSAIAPRGLCRELFYAVYPDCLAVLYNGVPCRGRPRTKGIRECVASCPAGRPVKVRIRCRDIFPGPLRVLKELVEEACKKWVRPFDAPYRSVTVEIIEPSPDCPKGYQGGERFRFNTSHRNELCPAGFATIYPYLDLEMNAKGKDGSPSSLCVHCPDYVGVTYEVIKGPEQGANKGASPVVREFQAHCRERNAAPFTVTYQREGREERISSKEMLPKDFCLLAFHSVYPYLRTLSAGGWFNWVNYKEHVIVNCPNPDGIAMFVKAPDRDGAAEAVFQVEVMRENGGCPKGHGLGDTFPFAFDAENRLRYEMLYKAAPFLSRFLSGGPAEADMTCMDRGDPVHGRVVFGMREQDL